MPAPGLSPADQNALVETLREKLSGITFETPPKRRRILITEALEACRERLAGLSVSQITRMANDSNLCVRVSQTSMAQYVQDAGIMISRGNRGTNSGCGANQIRKGIILRLVAENRDTMEIFRNVYNGDMSDRTRNGFRQMLRQLAKETAGNLREKLLAMAKEPIESGRYITFAVDTGQKNGARSGH